MNRRKLKEDELRAGRDKFLRDAEIQFRATIEMFQIIFGKSVLNRVWKVT